MQIEHASMEQVRTGRDGRRITIEMDVLEIVKQLREIDPSLSLHWNENGNYFVVVQTTDDGTEHLVTTTTVVDQRLVEHCRKLCHPDYDLVGEIERGEAAVDKAHDDHLKEQIGLHGERLQWALNKDLEHKHKIILPRGIEA